VFEEGTEESEDVQLHFAVQATLLPTGLVLVCGVFIFFWGEVLLFSLHMFLYFFCCLPLLFSATVK
jgi:hypothetical protein